MQSDGVFLLGIDGMNTNEPHSVLISMGYPHTVSEDMKPTELIVDIAELGYKKTIQIEEYQY